MENTHGQARRGYRRPLHKRGTKCHQAQRDFFRGGARRVHKTGLKGQITELLPEVCL